MGNKKGFDSGTVDLEGTQGGYRGLSDLISSLIFQPSKLLRSHLLTILLRSDEASNSSVLLADNKHHSAV